MKTVIQCARNWISGKPTIDKIINENKSEGVIVIATRYFYTNPTPVKIFILGSGIISDYEDINDFVIDTGMGYGRHGRLKVENIIEIDKNKIIKSINNIGINDKRVLYVFK